ncbi:hypothetical protein SMMN14_05512 [Sphaerulina musiva]
MKLLNMAFISVLAVLAHARPCDEKFDQCMDYWIQQDFPDINDLPQAYYDDFEACERKYYKADGHTCKSDDGGDDGDGDKCTKEQKENGECDDDCTEEQEENGECGNQKKKKRHHRRHVQHMRRAI